MDKTPFSFCILCLLEVKYMNADFVRERELHSWDCKRVCLNIKWAMTWDTAEGTSITFRLEKHFPPWRSSLQSVLIFKLLLLTSSILLPSIQFFWRIPLIKSANWMKKIWNLFFKQQTDFLKNNTVLNEHIWKMDKCSFAAKSYRLL